MQGRSRLVVVMWVVCFAALVATAGSAAAAPTIYLLSEGKILKFDAAPALTTAKAHMKRDAELDAEEAKEKAKAKAEGKIFEYKPRPKPVQNDPSVVISEGWKDAYDLATDGQHIYVLSKTQVGRIALDAPGNKEVVTTKLPEQVRQIQADGGYVYLATPSKVFRVKGDGSEEPAQITKGWGGMQDIAVRKGVVYIRMGSGEFYALRGKTWKDKLVGKGWKGILQMVVDAKTKKLYLFSGGQVFLLRPGSGGRQVMAGLTGDLEKMVIHKGKPFFIGRAGKIMAVEPGKKHSKQFTIRPKGSLVDDLLVL